MTGIFILATTVAPCVWALGVWVHRNLTGEYARLWKPFERALRTGDSSAPAGVDAAEWSKFLSDRRTGHRWAVAVQSLGLAGYAVSVVGFAPHATVFQVASLVLGVYSIAAVSTRLRRIDRLTGATGKRSVAAV
ncbi:hypothetical protein [Nocardia sp. NBC_00511]|uniref:hypothetical protein n=1 Tax=Nocardia sp. NBC_00511 TaxID=2903591 RepID=UPI0030E3D5F3